MQVKPWVLIPSCIGGAIMTALSGAVGLNTFGEMLVVFVVFSGVLYFTIAANSN
jgi:hypothetical protein